jgi:hypothetical protein
MVFLVPHTCHVCQPLDLCPSSIVKSKCRAQINTDEVKKIRFNELYHQARTEALAPIHIKAGWRAAGLILHFPNKALNSSLILEATLTPQLTSKSPLSTPQLAISTPHNRCELRATVDLIQSNEELSKKVRMLLNKTAKAFDETRCENAKNLIQLKGQQQKLEELRG